MSATESPALTQPVSPKRDTGVVLIILFKAIFGVLYLAVAVGVFSFINQDLSELANRLVNDFNLDPDNRFINAALITLPKITPNLLKQVALGTFCYGTLEIVQAVGLYFRQTWAEWLIIIATMLLIPFELLEILKHATPVKFAVLVLNIVIVWYLYTRHRKQTARSEA